MRNLMLGAALLVGATTSLACSKKVSPQECEKFADHMAEMTFKETTAMTRPRQAGPHTPPTSGQAAIDGMMKNLVQSQRGQFVQQCTGGMPRAAYECMMKAASIRSIQAECAGKY